MKGSLVCSREKIFKILVICWQVLYNVIIKVLQQTVLLLHNIQNDENKTNNNKRTRT